jgi:phosphoglycerate dehydrogenase-like enzyme
MGSDTRTMTPLVIVNHVDTLDERRVLAHRASPRLIQGDLREPWKVPPDAEVLVTCPLPGWKAVASTKPEGWPYGLKWVQLVTTGADIYPRWMMDGGVVVTCARGVSADVIAEYAIGAVFAHEKRYDEMRPLGPKDWRPHTLGTLQGKTIGLLGFGSIGAMIATMASALGMNVLAYKRSPWVSVPSGVRVAESVDALFAQSDHVVLALPATPETEGIVSRRVMSGAKPGLHLINIARGRLIDQVALVEMLDAGKLSGATLDVTEPEPLPEGHVLYTHPLVRLTPHVSWRAHLDVGARKFNDQFLDKLDVYLQGLPLPDVVDPTLGY